MRFISGASIAGPVLAYWLTRHGFSVTVVERAPSLEMGPQMPRGEFFVLGTGVRYSGMTGNSSPSDSAVYPA